MTGDAARPDVGAILDERLRDVGVALRNRPHQRGLAVRRLGGIDIRSSRDERLDRAQAAAASGGHQGGHPGGRRGVGIGAGREQALDDADAAVLAGQGQRADAMVIDRMGACA